MADRKGPFTKKNDMETHESWKLTWFQFAFWVHDFRKTTFGGGNDTLDWGSSMSIGSFAQFPQRACWGLISCHDGSWPRLLHGTWGPFGVGWCGGGISSRLTQKHTRKKRHKTQHRLWQGPDMSWLSKCAYEATTVSGGHCLHQWQYHRPYVCRLLAFKICPGVTLDGQLVDL